MRSCPRLVCSLPFCIIDALCSTLHAVAAAVAMDFGDGAPIAAIDGSKIASRPAADPQFCPFP